jgi:inorganic phosphate transporter, PiT family
MITFLSVNTLSQSVSSISIGNFFYLLGQSPLIVITVLLALGVVFINGWTDAPNAVATCISTKAISPKKAIIMSAVFNFIGVMIFSLFAAGVADTIAGIVDYGSFQSGDASSISNAKNALVGLSAGMIGVVAWGVLAWAVGVPSSESHALIAGLTGSCFALIAMGKTATPGGSAWADVGIGFAISSVVGLVLGFGVTRLIEMICYKITRNKTTKFFKWAQITSAAGMSLAHGAQDGLKFVGVIYLCLYLGTVAYPNENIGTLINPNTSGFSLNFINSPAFLWLPILVSLVMGIGTSIGGYRIIKKVGMGMVDLQPYQGFATDISAFIALMVSSLFGWPVSTSQVKTCSIIGVGLTRGVKAVNWKIALDMVLTWVFTFPGCILIGFAMTYLLFAIPGIC